MSNRSRMLFLTAVAVVAACAPDIQSPPSEPVQTPRPNPPLVTLKLPDSVVVSQLGSVVVPIDFKWSFGHEAAHLVVTDLPSDVTTSSNPSLNEEGSGRHTYLTIVAGKGAEVGRFSPTVKVATPEGTTQSIEYQLDLVVTPRQEQAGNASIDFSDCPKDNRPTWFAAFDPATSSWQQVIGDGDQYRIQGAYPMGVAFFSYASAGSGSWGQVSVLFRTPAEIRSLSFIERCSFSLVYDYSPSADTVSVSGTAVFPAGPDAHALVSLGGRPLGTERTWSQARVPRGLFDMVGLASAAKWPSWSNPRMVLHRDVDTSILPSGRLPLVDFSGADAFVPDSVPIAIPGVSIGPVDQYLVAHLDQAACVASNYQYGPLAEGLVGFGIPSALRRPTDRHQLSIRTSGGTNILREVTQTFDDLTKWTVQLPDRLRVDDFRWMSAPSAWAHAEFDTGPDVDVASIIFESATSRISISASQGYLGGRRAELEMPDFSAVGGWSDGFAVDDGESAWFVRANGHTGPVGPCGAQRTFIVSDFLDPRAFLTSR
ncbi:MAG: hypothetical protein U0132_19940 [Gemmatimonadaceae bacterium]